MTEHAPSLETDVRNALDTPDRWERRSCLRSLSAQLAGHTVSLVRPVFAGLAVRPIGCRRALCAGQYDSVRGIDSSSSTKQ